MELEHALFSQVEQIVQVVFNAIKAYFATSVKHSLNAKLCLKLEEVVIIKHSVYVLPTLNAHYYTILLNHTHFLAKIYILFLVDLLSN